MTIRLDGRIDSNNAAEVEKDLLEQLSAGAAEDVVIDAEELEYISSAGLRVILRLKKAIADTSLINVSPEVYDILDVTGFTEMMSVQKETKRKPKLLAIILIAAAVAALGVTAAIVVRTTVSTTIVLSVRLSVTMTTLRTTVVRNHRKVDSNLHSTTF